MPGEVGILNVGAGDTKLSFDPSNPAECIRAARIVKDMLRRGYALLVDSGRKGSDGKPVFVRATDFDENTHEYIIADFDPVIAAAADEEEAHEEAEPQAAPPALKPKRGRPPKQTARKEKRLPAGRTKAVAVAHTAGG